MSRYEVVFSARALESLKQVTRYIAEEAGTGRATDWLAKVGAGEDVTPVFMRACEPLGEPG